MPFCLLFSCLTSLFNQSQFRSCSLFLKTLARFLCPSQALPYLFLDMETRTACSNPEVNAQQNDYFVSCVFPSNFWQSICFFEHCSALSHHFLELLTATLSSLPWVARGSLKPIFSLIDGFIFSHVHYFVLIGTKHRLPFYCNATQYCEILPRF